MKKKVQYSTEKDRQKLLMDNSPLILIEEQNITEGNYLIFSDEPIEKEIVYINVPEQEFNQLKSRQDSTEEAISFLLGL